MPAEARGSTNPRKWGGLTLRLERGEVEVPVYSSTGGPILKVLFSTGCRMDCRYCPFAVYCRRPRSVWTRRRLVEAILASRKRGLMGVFLSSGLHRDPEEVTLELVEVVEEARRRGYNGYIHVKLMPGTPGWLIERALGVADRVSINLEAPSAAAFSEIAPSKGDWVNDLYSRLLLSADYAQLPHRVSTQLVVGASGESDREILRLTWLLHRSGVGVVHYSPYTPVPGTPLAEKTPPTPPRRTGALYEASRLLRDYGFQPSDFDPLLGDNGMLRLTARSLKEEIAASHPEWFPVNLENAGLRELLRVPGIGPRTAQRIIRLRENGARVTLWTLASLLPPRRLRRALPYLDLGGAGPRLVEEAARLRHKP